MPALVCASVYLLRYMWSGLRSMYHKQCCTHAGLMYSMMSSYKAFASSTHVLLFRFCHELYCSVVDTGYREVYATAIEVAGFLFKLILFRPLNPTMRNSQALSLIHI